MSVDTQPLRDLFIDAELVFPETMQPPGRLSVQFQKHAGTVEDMIVGLVDSWLCEESGISIPANQFAFGIPTHAMTVMVRRVVDEIITQVEGNEQVLLTALFYLDRLRKTRSLTSLDCACMFSVCALIATYYCKVPQELKLAALSGNPEHGSTEMEADQCLRIAREELDLAHLHPGPASFWRLSDEYDRLQQQALAGLNPLQKSRRSSLSDVSVVSALSSGENTPRRSLCFADELPFDLIREAMEKI